MALALAAATAPAAVRPTPQARATVRVLTPGTSTVREWDEAPASRRREIVVQEPDGRRTRLRLIDFE